MTPHRSGKRGTYILDRRTRIGRITIASGTNHAPTFRRLNQMLTVLDETGRGDLLRAIRDHELKPLAVYEAFRVNELHKLPTSEMMKPLRPAMEKWLAQREVSKAQKAADRTAINVLAGTSCTVGEIATELQKARQLFVKAKHPAQFNRVRSSALAFIRDTLKRSHRLYGEVRDVPLMKEKKAPERHILSWSEVQDIAGKLDDPRDRAAFYGMVLTGMGPKEWYVDGWKLTLAGVRIFGKKRSGRGRMVPAIYGGTHYAGPLVASDVGVEREKRRFGQRLLALAQTHPYDLRRSYANLLEAAGIPRTRRRLYMGHSRHDVTDIYEESEVKVFIPEDTERLERYLSSTERKGLEMVK